MSRIVKGGIIIGLRKEFSFRNRRDGITAVGGDIFGKMPEVSGKIRKSKVLTLSINEIVFG